MSAKCPKENCDGKLVVTQTYATEEQGSFQRAYCSKCLVSVTLQTVCTVLYVDPKRGEGAYAMAKRAGEGSRNPHRSPEEEGDEKTL